MNIDSRYDSCLSDMLTLLQQAVFRFVTDLQVDLNKFFQFFKQFHRNLISLQDNFHPSKSKFSKYLIKLQNISQQLDFSSKQRTLSLQPEKSFSKTLKSKELKTETLSKMSLMHEKTEELNVIGEIEEREDFDDIRFKVKEEVEGNEVVNKNRVGTAQGARRKMSVTIDFHNSRPYTGSYRRDKGSSAINKSLQRVSMQQGNERYRSLKKYEKARVDQQLQAYQGVFSDQPSQPTQKRVFNTVGQRKTIYQLLQEEKRSRNEVQSQEQMMKGGLVKIPQKRKNRAWSRWSFKINKLL